MVYILIFFPIAMAFLALVYSNNNFRPLLLPITGFVHTITTLFILIKPEFAANNSWLVLDPVGKIILISIKLQTLGHQNFVMLTQGVMLTKKISFVPLKAY